MPRVAAFGCFDDCFNYGAGYFLTKGKILYKDIFFNHQPLMAYISAGIQEITKPRNIYELLLRHRQFMLGWNLVWAIILITNFGLSSLFFVTIYEGSKFYIFGDRFLAEGIIVYPFVYLIGQTILLLRNKKIPSFQYGISFLVGVFIFFSREPYSVTVGILMAIIGLYAIRQRISQLWFLLPIVFSLGILFLFPLNDYWNNLVVINNQTVLQQSIQESNFWGRGLFQAFFYPVFIALSPARTFYHQILLISDLLFLISVGLLISQKKFRKLLLVVFVVLGSANLRVVPIGQMYYASFHLLPWYGLFLFITITFCKIIYFQFRTIGTLLIIGLCFCVGFIFTSPEAFFKEKINQQEELITNYGEEIKIGNAIQHLSTSKDTIFIDGWAELIYWQANRLSPYTYTWYTSVMPLIPTYSEAKAAMFRQNAPDFYYGTCPKDPTRSRMMPEFALPNYHQLNSLGVASCLWVKKSKLPLITEEQWNQAKEFLVDKPNDIQ